MAVDDQPGDLVGLIWNDRIFQECRQWQICQQPPGRDALFGGLRRYSRQRVAGPQGAGGAQNLRQVPEAMTRAGEIDMVSGHGKPPDLVDPGRRMGRDDP